MKNTRTFIIKPVSFAALCLWVSAVRVAAQVGGQFAVTQSVVAGGANSSGGNFGVVCTNAQSSAGVNSSGGQFRADVKISACHRRFYP